MKLRVLKHLFLLVFICFASTSISNDSVPHEYSTDRNAHMLDEAKFKARLKEVTRDAKWTNEGNEENVELCRSILSEIKNESYELIKPIAYAESYDDPVFDGIRNQCPELPVDYSIHHYQLLEKCTAGFFGFVGDFDNIPENGDEYMMRCERVIYEETGYEPASQKKRIGQLAYDNLVVYNIADLDQCEYRGRAVSFEYDYQNDQLGEMVSIPIRFKGETYLLRGGFVDSQYKTGSFIRISKFRAPLRPSRQDGNPHSVCIFSNIKKKRY